jgi:ADP-heptose:LPS heptosyltransferase
MRILAAAANAHFVVLWSPGNASNPMHPGDDEKARELMATLGPDFPATATATSTLPALITAISKCHALICADGGAMHIASGLNLPIVCLFGDSDVVRWRPWGVPYRLIQTPTRTVVDISPEDVVSSFMDLLPMVPVSPGGIAV